MMIAYTKRYVKYLHAKVVGFDEHLPCIQRTHAAEYDYSVIDLFENLKFVACPELVCAPGAVVVVVPDTAAQQREAMAISQATGQ